MSETTTESDTLEILLVTCQRIEDRLARLEDFISAYRPLLEEVTKRMAGPMRWQKGR